MINLRNSSKDQGGTIPPDLDECQGRTSATVDYPNGVYHYHISSTDAPNLPTYLKGVAARRSFTHQ
ncbi:YHYH protein [Bernardetia litoralis]|uniref:YHYH protein n=1 Tax=Bernardetia litoralis TaxID=999 RepID=UPI0002FB7AF4|nr:YHYH protein [Bernardetia litoralis]